MYGKWVDLSIFCWTVRVIKGVKMIYPVAAIWPKSISLKLCLSWVTGKTTLFTDPEPCHGYAPDCHLFAGPDPGGHHEIRHPPVPRPVRRRADLWVAFRDARRTDRQVGQRWLRQRIGKDRHPYPVGSDDRHFPRAHRRGHGDS